MSNKLKGGLSDNLTLSDIAKKHKVKLDSLKKELALGLKFELEHTKDKTVATEIAMDHLYENPEYYTKLKQMDIDEVTDASSSGAYDVPFGDKKNPLAIHGEISIKNSRAVKDKNFPKFGGKDGVYVKIKEKCKKFPYCNQGDIDSLEIFENVDFINEFSKENNIKPNVLVKLMIKEVMKPIKKNILENIIQQEVKNVLNESKVISITIDGKLVDTFKLTEKDKANKLVDELKEKYPKQQILIDYTDEKTFDEIDEMCDDLNEKKEDVINPQYTHFLVNKETNKILNGWDYNGLENDEIKEYSMMDINDMDIDKKLYKVVGLKYFKKLNINPFDESNWENYMPLQENEKVCSNCNVKNCDCHKKLNENKTEKTVKKITLKESQLIDIISEIISENKTDKENVVTKLQKLKKGDKEEIELNRGRNSQDLVYDVEPDEKFNKNVEAYLKGDSTKGNSQDTVNSIKTKTGENILKKSEKLKKIKKETPFYKKEAVPVKVKTDK